MLYFHFFVYILIIDNNKKSHKSLDLICKMYKWQMTRYSSFTTTTKYFYYNFYILIII